MEEGRSQHSVRPWKNGRTEHFPYKNFFLIQNISAYCPCEQDVLRALRRNPRLYLPLDVDFDVIQAFVRETVRFAWEASALAHPLDVALAFDAEVFDDNKFAFHMIQILSQATSEIHSGLLITSIH